MDIKELQKNWDEFGKTDPLWAIIVSPDKKGNKWRIDGFFRTGVEEIDTVMKYVESLSINIPRRKALDFGCGVGRLTQRMAHYFDQVYGIDIAPSMIELAKKYNRYGEKCKYYLNETDDLKLFSDDSFDFIYTNITLQHMEPSYSKNYIKEFLMILTPHGLLIFQLPSGKRNQLPSGKRRSIRQLIKLIIPPFFLGVYRNINRNQPRMEMYWIKREDMVKFFEEKGGKIVDIIEDQSAGKNFVSLRYCVTKE